MKIKGLLRVVKGVTLRWGTRFRVLRFRSIFWRRNLIRVRINLINLISNYSKKFSNLKSQKLWFLGIRMFGHSLGQLGQLEIRSIKKPLALALAFAMILTLVIINPASKTPRAQAAWYSTDWNYRQKIIIDHNKVPNTDQPDFPVMVKITDQTNPVFTKAQDDGDDLLFTSSNETSQLSHEIETFSKDNHEFWAWVKIPTLSYTTDTVIYLYYGNASCESQQNATDVWSNGYVGVWHLDEQNDGGAGGSNLYTDSTSNNNIGKDYISNTGKTGKIGNGQQFDGSNDYIKVLHAASLNVASAWNVETWVNTPGKTEQYYSAKSSNNYRTGIYRPASVNKLRLSLSTIGYAYGIDQEAPAVTLDSWHHIVWNYEQNPTGVLKLYIDGNLYKTYSNGGGDINTNSDNLILGARWTGADALTFIGNMDEFRWNSATRSADWIATEYANQNSPETFMNIGGEVGKDNYTIPTEPAGWYAPDWAKRQPITLNPTHDKVPNTDQTNFPTLIKLTDAGNDLWASAQTDGDDILFADTFGNKLAHEIEKYDATAHELWAWVKIPTLATGATTTIYIYYGNANSPNQQSKTAVWSNGYVNVRHLNESSSPYLDSSTYANSSTAGTYPSQTTGKVDKGQQFASASKHYISSPEISGRFPSTAFTLSAWVNVQSTSAPAGFVSWGTESDHKGWSLMFNSSKTPYFYTGGGSFTGIAGSALTDGWHLIQGTYDGTARLYVDGIHLDVDAVKTIIAPVTTQPLVIGRVYSATDKYYSNQPLDEVRVSSVTRSADWIATEYSNQNDPATFESFGAMENPDTFDPTNPTVITATKGAGGEPLGTAGTWPTPYYYWPEPEAVGGATDQTGEYISGVAGYYSYFGTSCGGGGADPEISRGVLSDTGDGLHYSSDINISVPDLTTNEDDYCFRIKTKDNAGNISTVTEAATYAYDLTDPNPPSFVAVNPAGYSSVDSFDFTWPAATDPGGSGIAGYQYKRGNGVDDWSATQVETSANDITSYQTGENVFMVRSVDNAGNTSASVQTTYYFSNTAPTKPTALTADPEISDENAFSFSWTAPVHDRPIVDYGYSINAEPTAENLTWTGSDDTSLAEDAFATVQGVNTFYLVAKDDSGAYALSDANVATVTFYCSTSAPPIPTQVSISDSSNRAYSTYSLTIKWSAGTGQDPATFDHYLIERSTNGTTFTELATTSSTAYIDVSSLSNTVTYYYRVKAVDNADSTSAASSTVSKIPTGKYTTPPTIVSGPEVSLKATSATITWVTNRTATAGVRFGTSESSLSRSQIDPTEDTEHSITIPGLDGSTRYFYEVQSLDNDRDYSSDDAYSPTYNFDTLALPAISDVKVSNITLSSAELSWTTSAASNVAVAWGTTIDYGQGWEDSESFTTNHAYKLTDLDHTTTYHFKITGTDEDDNELVSDDYVFDTLPEPKISAVSFETDLKETQPKSFITWTTNVPTTSSVEYVPRGGNVTYEESQSSLITSHKVELSHLSDDTSYSFYVFGSDQFGNKATSDEYIFSTPFDSRPAQISDVLIETSNVGLNKRDKAQIVVSWKTDEPATGYVEYSEGLTGTSYKQRSAEDNNLAASHLVIISDLKPNQPYHLRVLSRDKGSNLTESADNSIIAGEVPKSIFNIIIETFENIFGWMGKMI